MTKIFKTAVFFTFLCAAAPGCFSDDGPGFSVLGNRYSPYMGISGFTGFMSAGETVYREPGSDAVESLIEWNGGIHGGMGVRAGVGPRDIFKSIGIDVKADILWSLPGNNGRAADSDWFATGEPASYGEFTVSLVAGTELVADMGLLVPVGKILCVRIGGRLWYSRFMMLAVDGWTARNGETVDLYGLSIQYVQEWICFSPALSADVKIGVFRLSAGGSVFPFVRGTHVDWHFFRTADSGNAGIKHISYKDTVSGGVWWSAGGAWEWKMTESLSVTVEVGYTAVSGSRGDTEIRTAGTAGYLFREEGKAGAGIGRLRVTAAVGIVL